MNIVTITLNPAFDLHYTIPDFKAGEENYVQAASISAGGKSVNISRALQANGVDNIACIVMGQDNADKFEAKLREEGIEEKTFLVPGRIRENITIHTQSGEETRISMDTFSLKESFLSSLYDKIAPLIEKDTVITLSGRLPRGISTEAACDFCLKLKEKSPYLILDSNSLTVEDLKKIGPWLIKPNESELKAMTGIDPDTSEKITEAASELCRQGIAQVLVTLGARGAVYVGSPTSKQPRVVAVVTQPKVKPISTIGAGDSTIAGFIKGWKEGAPIEQCLKTAIAFGSSACLREGTAPPLASDIETIRANVRVTLSV